MRIDVADEDWLAAGHDEDDNGAASCAYCGHVFRLDDDLDGCEYCRLGWENQDDEDK